MRLARDTARRKRRLTALAGAGLAAVAIGIAVGAGDGGEGDSRPGESAERSAATAEPPLPLRRAVGELLVMAFDGTSAPEYVRRRLRDGQGAGVILFGGNVVDATQLRRLTRTIQRAARGGALIATDQEGGEIRNVPFAGPVAGQSAAASPAAAGAAAGE
ncbi:MAG: hypothetical protein M3N56_03980, partial [Actinomycetota bacterium]|nr:hypothetical protein [Actinomycetota bacterium]